MRIVSLVVFVLLQILFLPLAIVGVALITYKQMVVSRRHGVSQTAVEVVNGRWTMDRFDLRKDEASVRLARALPNTSLPGLWLCLFPLYVKYRIDGKHWLYPRIPEPGAETIADVVAARTMHFDRILERAVGSMTQFVVLGAGFDARAYGTLKRDGLASFEVDQANIQELKIRCLDQAGLDRSQVRFVAVDFSRERAFEKLQAAGYDPRQKTLFLWEGVTPYLAEADVRRTLQDIREHSPAGSVVAADFYGERFVRMGRKGTTGGTALAFTKEGFDFGLPFETDAEATLRGFAESENLRLQEAWFLGANHRKGPYAAVAELVV